MQPFPDRPEDTDRQSDIDERYAGEIIPTDGSDDDPCRCKCCS